MSADTNRDDASSDVPAAVDGVMEKIISRNKERAISDDVPLDRAVEA